MKMNIRLERINDDYLFECTNNLDQKILLNNNGEGEAKGVSPMEALLMSLVGCASMDIVAILKKQKQEILHFAAEVFGERTPKKQANPFKKIHIVYYLDGEIDPGKAARAADLSFEKYCSVSLTLDPAVEISWEVKVNEG